MNPQILPLTATVFSYAWDLRLNNQSVGVPFGNMRFSHAVSGFGTSYCTTGQFEFDLYDEYDLYGTALLEEVPVQLVESNSQVLPSRTYYIAKRSISKKICHFTAYDVMSRIEQDFYTSLGEIWGDEIPCGNVLDAIKQTCKFTSIGSSAPGMDYIKFTREQLSGKTCRAILEMVATAMCGTWIATKDDGIVLSCLGESLLGSASSSNYSEIDYQGRQKITKLIMTNAETGKVQEFSTGEYGTVISVESPFVAAGTPLDSTVWQRVSNYIYQAWHCDKAITDDFIAAGMRVTFGDTELLANNVTLDVDSTGIYFSGGSDPQDEEQWKYDDYTQRQLNNKLELDKRNGNMAVTGDGLKIFTNKNRTANKREKTTVIKFFESEV